MYGYYFIVGLTASVVGYTGRMLGLIEEQKPQLFPPVTRDHHIDDLDRDKVVPYSKFRARRLIQEKERAKTRTAA